VLVCAVAALTACVRRDPPLDRSGKSAPPDTTPYVRPAVPEDYAPAGQKAIPPGVTVPGRPDESSPPGATSRPTPKE
jgi:hypothetical protein